MNQTVDLLADRVSAWTIETKGSTPQGEQCLRGWALLGQLKRRGPSAKHLIETVEPRLGNLPYPLISTHIERAHADWTQLLADLDREEENLEHVRQSSQDVFFSVLDALLLAEESGHDADAIAARRLFNAVANDLYAFEPMADVAAELQRRSPSQFELSDLLCTGVARLFDGQVRPHPAPDARRADDFIPLTAMLKGADAALKPAALGKRLAKVEWWYVQWAAQRVRLAVLAKTRQLCLYVWEGQEAALAMSTAMDGWDVRAGDAREATTATIQSGSALLTLPQRIDPATFAIQLRSAPDADWADLFARAAML